MGKLQFLITAIKYWCWANCFFPWKYKEKDDSWRQNCKASYDKHLSCFAVNCPQWWCWWILNCCSDGGDGRFSQLLIGFYFFFLCFFLPRVKNPAVIAVKVCKSLMTTAFKLTVKILSFAVSFIVTAVSQHWYLELFCTINPCNDWTKASKSALRQH